MKKCKNQKSSRVHCQNIQQSWGYLACTWGEIVRGEIARGEIVWGEIAQGEIAQGEIRQNIHKVEGTSHAHEVRLCKVRFAIVYIKLYRKNQKSSSVH